MASFPPLATPVHLLVYIYIYIYGDHVYFRYSCQNVNVEKRIVNFRFDLIMFWISVWA